jgi:hypothetical protein
VRQSDDRLGRHGLWKLVQQVGPGEELCFSAQACRVVRKQQIIKGEIGQSGHGRPLAEEFGVCIPDGEECLSHPLHLGVGLDKEPQSAI